MVQDHNIEKEEKNMNQLPITYPMSYQQPAYSCNAVKIDIHNPQAGVPTMPAVPQQMAAAPIAQTPTAQFYNYPNNSVYGQNPMQYPIPYFPQQPVAVPPQLPIYQTVPPQPVIVNDTASKIQPPTQQIATIVPPAPQQPQAPQQIINNTVPAPVAAPKDTMQTVEETSVPSAVKAEDKPQEVKNNNQNPEVDIKQSEEFNAKLRGDMLNRLTSQDLKTQSDALVEIANATQQLADTKKAISLKGGDSTAKEAMQREYDKAFDNLASVVLDEKVVESILGILVKDTTNLEQPTPKQIELRTKEMNGTALSEAEKIEAETLSPMEKAEQNKEFALFTLRLIQEMYMEGIEKMTGSQPDLKDVPGVEQMIVTIKSNPNPAIRAAAISAITHNSRPQDKEILSTLLKIASEQDADDTVRATAAQSLTKITQ